MFAGSVHVRLFVTNRLTGIWTFINHLFSFLDNVTRRLARRGIKLAARKPDTTRHKNISDIDARKYNWKRLCHARHYYHLRDLNLVMANDEINVPLECHAPIIYELAAVRHPLIFSNCMERVTFTLFCAFTGRRLSPVFIFKAAELGNIHGYAQSKNWSREWLPNDERAYFFFAKFGMSNEWIYFQILSLMYSELLEPYVKSSDMPALKQRLLPPWLQQDSQAVMNFSKELNNDSTEPLVIKPSQPRLDPESGQEFEIKLPHTTFSTTKLPRISGEIIKQLLSIMNTSYTFVYPTGYVQIFDAGMARMFRAGQFALHSVYFSRNQNTEVSIPSGRVCSHSLCVYLF